MKKLNGKSNVFYVEWMELITQTFSAEFVIEDMKDIDSVREYLERNLLSVQNKNLKKIDVDSFETLDIIEIKHLLNTKNS